jgi:Kef-type K+ transport system membrane component KefB
MLEAIISIYTIFNEIIASNPLSTIGLLLIVSFLGSKVFQRFGIPQVVGFIVLGVLHGPSFLNVIPLEVSQELLFISEIALGLIGFDMGSHLRLSEIQKLGKSIIFILIFEAFGAFFLVTAGVYALTQSWYTALIFGALSSATAPAATVDVLAEYDSKGPLTTTLLAVVGLDDALSLLLYSLAAAFTAALLAGGETPTLVEILELPIIEIGGSILLGASMGYALNWLMHRMKSRHDAMAISIGFVLLAAGISLVLNFSLILTTLVLGMVTVNCCPDHGRHIRFTIEQAGPVIYVLFFTLVGARFQISLLPTMGLLGVAYIVFRSLGKFGGAWIGGRLGGAEQAVRNNLGFGLLSQAGVAIGLALASASRFSQYGEEGQALGSLIINVITATTFVVQIIGPIAVKFAITRAGEVGKAREDLDDIWASEGKPE